MTTINDKIKDLRFEYGKEHIKQEDLSIALGIPSSTISDYEKPGFYVPADAIIKYCDYFNVSADFLLGRTEIKQLPNLELHELHLSEKAMEKLKTHKVNPQIVSELIEHEEFDALILDMDIYSKGFVDEGLMYINGIMKKTRESLSDFPKGSYDKNRDLKTMTDITVSQDLYFAHAIYERLNIILKDIKAKHKNDFDSSDVTPESVNNQLINLTDSLSEINEKPNSAIATAIRSGIMLALKIKPTPQNIALIDGYVNNLKIDTASARNLAKTSELIESNDRKRRKAKNQLKK